MLERNEHTVLLVEYFEHLLEISSVQDILFSSISVLCSSLLKEQMLEGAVDSSSPECLILFNLCSFSVLLS